VAQGGREDHRACRRAPRVLDSPAAHWLHLRTTNPIESTFATVRLRQRVTKDPARGPPESRWRSSSSSRTSPLAWRQRPHLVALVRAGAMFEKGALIERPDESGDDQQVA
jgi:putative transposase